jgi:TDG/mug DNA glycosylase family protein
MPKGHRVIEQWMGTEVETLEDLLRPALRAVCVGINPAPVSVAAGHYYQGSLGKAFFRRLSTAGLLPPGPGWEDDRAFDARIGFTDIVKRPTGNSSEVRPEEYESGREILRTKLEKVRPRLLIFTFKKTATKLFGSFEGNGLIAGREMAGARVFVMPGPYEAARPVAAKLEELRHASGGDS